MTTITEADVEEAALARDFIVFEDDGSDALVNPQAQIQEVSEDDDPLVLDEGE